MSRVDPDIIQRGLVAAADSIVNPRCDECRTPISKPHPSLAGLPRLCSICQAVSDTSFQALAKDWHSQERPRGRTIHVVKLPEGMRNG
jgi:hypothetical protein